MAPALLESTITEITPTETKSKGIQICSDPSVVPSIQAPQRVKELWWLHGHPHSKRYADPKLTSLAALVRNAGEVYRHQEAFLYPMSTEATTPYESMTWNEFNSVTESLALSYAFELQSELQEANRTRKQPTVALLGAGKTLDYFCTQLALLKLGLRVLLLAESNAEGALHFLLEKCDVQAVIVDSRNASTDLRSIRKLKLIEKIPEASSIDYKQVDAVKFQDYGNVWERHTFIIHSSGSTGMPKPIMHTNRSLMSIARMYRLFQDFEIENWFLLFPLYHIAGVSIALSNFPNGALLSFPPLAWPPSASSLFAAWKTLASMGHRVDCVHCAPTLVETMYDYILENGEDFNPLASLKVLQPGGAVLSDTIIQDLISHGVNVKTTYGTTEIGPPMRPIPHTRANPNCYTFRNLYPDNPFLKMEKVGDNVYEVVVYKGFELAADLWEGGRSNKPYRTNDLFVQDPPGSGFYIMKGRKDDILVHTNGENTAAAPLQLDIQTSSKVIHKALALGHSQPCVCLLVEVNPEYDPSSVSTHDKIWQSVERINARYPTHSRILRSMIYILPKGSSLPITPKGNVRRREAESIYASEIQQLYDSVFASPKRTPMVSEEPLADFIRTLFSRVSQISTTQITDTTSLYDLGIDSRLALTIRSVLSSRLNKPISLSTIFENPSIAQLVSRFEAKIATQLSVKSETSTSQVVLRMIAGLEAEFKTWAPRSSTLTYPPVEGETVLLTGSTGSLGTSLLESLTASSSVTKIYAMVRGTNHSARLLSSLQEKGLDTSILSPSGKIHVLNFSMQDPLLGLDIDTYHKLAEDVTLVVQNAWKMDFNIGVEEFEHDCIRSTMSLLRLCHAGRPKRFAFTSSISTCLGPSSPSLIPESPLSNDPTVALPTGYAQSKYIIERVLHTASLPSSLSIPIQLLRVGQLCGHTCTGRWNTDEMWPIMFATSVAMGALPTFEGRDVDWVPVDVAANVISELLLLPQSPKTHPTTDSGSEIEPAYAVSNIVNPHPIAWSSLLLLLQNSLHPSPSTNKLEEVSMAEWVKRLNTLADEGADPEQVPGLRLLGFWEDMVGTAATPLFDTEKSRGRSQSLRELGGFSEEWLDGNVRAWREGGFLGVMK